MTFKNKLKIAASLLLILLLGTALYTFYPRISPNPVPNGAINATETSTQSVPAETVAPTTESTPIPSEAVKKPLIVLEKFKSLLEQNKDVVGWINLPNTKIDYPVAQSNDNDYYLHRNLDKKKYEPGTIFMDFRNDTFFEDRHSILYGHNMKNGSMFATLKLYKKEDFYNANRIFTYTTLYDETQWEVFAAYVSPPTLDLITTDFKDDQAFLDYIAIRQKQSKYAADIKILPTDKILTLITCSYEFNDARFVIHARKIEKRD